MINIESIAQKGFFIGMLAIILEFKVRMLEKNHVEQSGGIIEQSFKHVGLIREISPLLYIEFILMRSLYNFINKDLSSEIFRELIEVYKYFKILKKAFCH